MAHGALSCHQDHYHDTVHVIQLCSPIFHTKPRSDSYPTNHILLQLGKGLVVCWRKDLFASFIMVRLFSVTTV